MLASRRISSIFGKVRHIDTHSDTGSRLSHPPQPHWADDGQAELVICFKPIEQDHRFVKKRIAASLWFRSVDGALRTIEGYEAMNMIRKGQVRRLAKGDVVGQVRFIEQAFGIAA